MDNFIVGSIHAEVKLGASVGESFKCYVSGNLNTSSAQVIDHKVHGRALIRHAVIIFGWDLSRSIEYEARMAETVAKCVLSPPSTHPKACRQQTWDQYNFWCFKDLHLIFGEKQNRLLGNAELLAHVSLWLAALNLLNDSSFFFFSSSTYGSAVHASKPSARMTKVESAPLLIAANHFNEKHDIKQQEASKRMSKQLGLALQSARQYNTTTWPRTKHHLVKHKWLWWLQPGMAASRSACESAGSRLWDNQNGSGADVD